MEPRRDDPYEVLGVARGATVEEITRRHRILSHIFHPDRYQTASSDVREEAERRMKTVNAAYDVLKRRGSPEPHRAPADPPTRPARGRAASGPDDTWERMSREARERAERAARAHEDAVWEEFARRARERAEQEARQRFEAARVRAEKVRERVVHDVRQAAYQQTRREYEGKTRERAEQEARQRAQREARERRRILLRFARRLGALWAGRTT
jgi:curved DNA-binding protein CbpA